MTHLAPVTICLLVAAVLLSKANAWAGLALAVLVACFELYLGAKHGGGPEV
jgi:hypothetical protein